MKNSKKKYPKSKVTVETICADLTAEILEALENTNAKDFVLPFHRMAANGFPMNETTGKCYQGFNVLILWSQTDKKAYQHNAWATFNQWKSKDAKVIKGEKGTPILCPVTCKGEKKNIKTGEKKAFSFLRFRVAYVFNVSQVEGYKMPEIKNQFEDTTEQVKFIDNYISNIGAATDLAAGAAYYMPSQHKVFMPPRENFFKTKTSSATQAYYSTYMHELTHWTKHKSVLNRNWEKYNGKQNYAIEELCAELGATFACSLFGIEPTLREDHTQYLKSWINALKNEPKTLLEAASQAQKAVNYFEACQQKEQAAIAA